MAEAWSFCILLMGLVLILRMNDECREGVLGFNEAEVWNGMQQGFWEGKEGHVKVALSPD